MDDMNFIKKVETESTAEAYCVRCGLNRSTKSPGCYVGFQWHNAHLYSDDRRLKENRSSP